MAYGGLNMQTLFRSRLLGNEAYHFYVYGPGDQRLLVYDVYRGERTFKFCGQSGEVLREYKVTGWGANNGN